MVRTQLTSQVAEKAQRGDNGVPAHQPPARLPDVRQGRRVPAAEPGDGQWAGRDPASPIRSAHSPSPFRYPAEVLLDRERCVSCARCTRFSEQIAGDPFIELFERGPEQQIAIAPGHPFQSYFSGNTVQICPVGALTGAAYRFRARPFDLVSTPGVCEHCASGCRIRSDHRRGKITRRLAGNDPQVNEEWNCDKGRWAFTYATQPDRLVSPLVRGDDGVLVPASWAEAVAVAVGRARTRPWPGRCPHRWAAHPRRRLRVREVRPHRPGQQRHRHACAAAFGGRGPVHRRRGGWPWDRGQLSRTWKTPRSCCSPGSSRKKSRRSSS